MPENVNIDRDPAATARRARAFAFQFAFPAAGAIRRTMIWALRFRALLLLISLAPAVDKAQAQDDERADVSPNVSVSERFSGQFDALGWKIGGFTARPEISAGTDFDDNIFASSNEAVEDFVAVLGGVLNVSSNWSRHSARMSARITRRQLFENSAESTTNYQLSGNGVLQLSRLRLVAAGGYVGAAEPRFALQTAQGADSPVRFSRFRGSLSAGMTFTRVGVSANVSFTDSDFQDARSAADGSNIDQDFRDALTVAAAGRVSFRVRPAIATFAEIQITRSDYDFPRAGPTGPVFQDSDGFRIAGGVTLDINKIARGEILAGYEERDFQSDVFGDVSGPSVDASVEYFLSGLTTITVEGRRSIEDSIIFGDGSFVTNRIGVSVDHELLRKLIISARVAYRVDEFRGFDRRDNLLTYSVGAEYLLGRRTLVRADYSFGDLNSPGTFGRGGYNRNSVGISLRYKF